MNHQNQQKSQNRFRILLGKFFRGLGYSMIPLCFGLMVGFYFADRGLAWLPTTFEIVTVLSLIGFLSIPLGSWFLGKAFEDSVAQKKVRKRIVFFCALAGVAAIVRLAIFWTEVPAPLTQLSHAEFNRAFAIDTVRFVEINKQMTQVLDYLKAYPELKEKKVLSSLAEKELLDAWSSFYNSALVLDQIRIFYEDWYRFDPSRLERSFHLRSFLLTYVSELTLYEKGFAVTNALSKNPNAFKFLDKPHPQKGLPANSLSRLKQELLGARDMARLVSGDHYLKLIKTGLNAYNEAQDLHVAWVWDLINVRIDHIKSLGIVNQTIAGIKADVQPIQRRVRYDWLNTQSKVAEWMGDTRVRRIGHYLITPELQSQIDELLHPGDVLLARKNWYLSNVGLPGFWPHAMLYLGEPEKFKVYFNVDEVHELVEEISGQKQSLHSYLAEKYPGAWAHYILKNDKKSHQLIEAVSEGVVFSHLSESAGDYFVGLRPKLDKRAKAQAVIKAFSHFGKPYDYDFDFATNHALVCTELVWRSYRPGPNKKGLNIPLISMMGRKTLPANEIAKLYTHEKNKAEQQFDFVVFVDANEKQKKAFLSDEASFIKSYERTKWDVALQ